MARTLQPEDHIAQYRVVGPLGAGGMGEVYLAHDTTLERDVALKVLPTELVKSEDRVRRFVLEAKSASSLSHPHIVTIYEIGHAPVRASGEAEGAGDEVHYIAMELVKGHTFQDLIHKERADLKTMLGYLAQAAEGLSKAHAAGIVHRDLKPGNIMVTSDGYAKVLDFGLAKLTERSSGDQDLTSAPTAAALTGAGMVVGTAGYMSPEQVHGKSLDARSDVFSFGCILYEATTRSQPFAAGSDIDTMHQIVHDDPKAVDGINPEAPAELRRLIKRCLAKNPNQRLQSIKDLAIELREIVDEFDTLSASATSGSIPGQPAYLPPKGRSSSPVIAAVVVLGIAGIVFGVWTALNRGGAEPADGRPFQTTRISSLMSDTNLVAAALSGDGRYLAYIKGPAGQWSLWVRQVATGSDVEILAPQTIPIADVKFSPDGNYLYYLRSDPETPIYSALFEVPSLGGAPRKRVFDIDTAVSFSPDGRRATFVRRMPTLKQDHLVVAELGTGQEQVLAAVDFPEEIMDWTPAWSPDGSRIVIPCGNISTLHYGLLAFDVEGGGREWISDPAAARINSIAWLPDGRGLVGTSQEARGLPSQVYFFPYPRGEHRQITNDLDSYGEVSVSADGASLAVLRTSRDTSIWVQPLGKEGEARQVTSRSTTERTVDLVALPDGSIVFTAYRDRYRQLWTMARDGTGRRPITTQAGWSFSLRSTSEGHAIVFSHFDETEAEWHVWRVDPDGGNLRQVTDGSGELLMDVTSDGSAVLFTRPESPNALWSAPIDGGEPILLLDDNQRLASYSRDGRLLLSAILEEIEGRQRAVYRVTPAGGGDPIARFIPPGDAYDLEWLPDGTGISYIHAADGVQNLWRQPVSGGSPVQLTRFSEGQIDGHQHAPDGGRILVRRALGAAENLWTVAPDGTGAVQVTDFRDGVIFDATWARDGESVILVQGDLRRDVVKLTDSGG